ncbi:MAG: 2-oxoacid:ferredoxin oxidoreductase subunit beta [Chloroflexi bacterium]|nr:2-oxoacid:ferredoxin oxidoreductase subunit beta [Chloroflexota bacterium]MCL5275488.1 2-oxoacid:ferredoxin oxidoreductase subunit beta [Chloroflexota bacterium]
MTTVPVVKLAASSEAPARAASAAKKLNIIGLERIDYKGADSTLCAGCGHDSIASQIITACYEMGVRPERMIKLSGIGCSSKSPAYFMSRSFGINTLHGRMAPVATGALTANHKLYGIGVSGDGDTGSIGLGNFKHMLRRNLRMVYIIENNGVYGLTKGQFSATADIGQELRHAGRNDLPPVDLCLEAIAAECGFVARGFAGDPKQVVALIKAALAHGGTAVLDIISPCVTFNNKDESTKSYSWGKANDERINDFTFVPPQEEIRMEFKPGEMKEVELHDGSRILLKNLDQSHDPTDRNAAMNLLQDARENQLFITGLIYVNPNRESLAEHENLGDTPLVQIPNEKLRPSRESLQKITASMA